MAKSSESTCRYGHTTAVPRSYADAMTRFGILHGMWQISENMGSGEVLGIALGWTFPQSSDRDLPTSSLSVESEDWVTWICRSSLSVARL